MFGDNIDVKRIETPLQIKKVTACHLNDCTTFIQFNGSDTMIAEAGNKDSMQAADTIEVNLSEFQ